MKRQEVGGAKLNAASCCGERDESTQTRQHQQRASLQHTGQIKPFWSPAHRPGPVRPAGAHGTLTASEYTVHASLSLEAINPLTALITNIDGTKLN